MKSGRFYKEKLLQQQYIFTLLIHDIEGEVQILATTGVELC